MQHLKKFMKEQDTSKVRQTFIVTGDPKIPRRASHSALTSLRVGLARNTQNASNVHYDAGGTTTQASECVRFRLDSPSTANEIDY